jgi:histone H3/H4
MQISIYERYLRNCQASFDTDVFQRIQVDRSLKGKSKEFKQAFKRALFSAINRLRKKADRKTLKNEDIRKEIKELARKTGASVGQSQKGINVYLKYYCILTNKPKKIIRELDCPLDSTIISKFGKGQEKIRLKDMRFTSYMKFQNRLEKEGNGIRLKPDIEIYDKKRIKKFLGV